MMVLMIATILASFALGVTLAYGACYALFILFRMHTHSAKPAPLPMRTKIVHP